MTVETLTAIRRSLALLPDIADLARPSPAARVGVRRHPAGRPARRRRPRRSPSTAPCAPCRSRARSPQALRARPARPTTSPPWRTCSAARRSASTCSTRRSPRCGRPATSAVAGEVAAFTAFRAPRPRRLHARRARPAAGRDLRRRPDRGGVGLVGPRRAGSPTSRERLAPVLRAGADAEAGRRAGARRVAVAGADGGARGRRPRGDHPRHRRCRPAGTRSLEPGPASTARWRWLRRAGAAVDGDTPFHVALRRLVVAGGGRRPRARPSSSRRLRGRPAARCSTVCRTTPPELAAWSGDDGLVLRWSMTRPERGVENTRPDVAAPLGEPARHPAAAARGRAGRGPPHAGARRGARRRRRPRVRPRPGRGVGGRAARRHRAGRLRRRRAREGDPPVHRAPPGRSARTCTSALPADGAGRPAVRRDVAAAARSARCRASWPSSAAGSACAALLREYGELITTVMPCVLVSPDSVARFFPATAGLFDLVVFDEASQIRVADAVGALGRARAAVVVGDSKQMPPTTFFGEPAGDDESADLGGLAVEDEESILSECVQARVPRQWLSWHYRSQDESLIAFSNAAYYENRLSSFPAPLARPPLRRARRPRRLAGAGRAARSTGRAPGGCCAPTRWRPARSSRRSAAGSTPRPDSPPSIGVVTFNAQQRTLHRGAAPRRGRRPAGRGARPHRRRGHLRQEPGERAGRRARRRLLLHRLLPRRQGPAAAELRPAEPRRRRAAAQRGGHPRAAAGRRLLVVRPRAAARRGDAPRSASSTCAPTSTWPRRAPTSSPPTCGRRPSSTGTARRSPPRCATRGLVVRTDVGLSDFKVDLAVASSDDPDTPVMAVLLDGPAWARRRTVADRDGLPVEVLGRDAALAGGRAGLAAVVAGRPRGGARPAGRRRPRRDRRRARARSRSPSRSRWPTVTRLPLPAASNPEPGKVAALRSAVTAAVAAPVPAKPRPTPKKRKPTTVAGPTGLEGEAPFKAWAPKTAGEKDVLDALPESKAARAVRTRAAGRDPRRGADPRRPADPADRGGVRAVAGHRRAQGRAARAAAAVRRRGRRLLAQGPRPPVERLPPPGDRDRAAAGPRAGRGGRQRDGRAVPGVGRHGPRRAAHRGRAGLRRQAPHARADAGPGAGAAPGGRARPPGRAAQRPASPPSEASFRRRKSASAVRSRCGRRRAG